MRSTLHQHAMATPVVYFDEAGNTGAALMDSAQPVFVLASIDLADEESNELLNLVRTPQTNEAKFTALRRSAAGQERLLELIRSGSLTPERAKTSILHKRFMIVTKFIDIIEETLAHAAGVDLYERGANIGLANLHYYASPVFCGKERFEEFLASFVAMIRNQTAPSKERFFGAARAMYEFCRNKDHRASFAPYIYAERDIDEILRGITYRSLDPAIPAFFEHCANWGSQIGGAFHAIHDSSKPMAAERTTFEAMIDQTIEPAVIGYDRRKFEFPLKATGITFADSRAHASLQLADLLSGATAYRAAAVSRRSKDELSDALAGAGIDRFLIGTLWPSTDVTPEALGTYEVGGINAVNYMADALNKKRT